MRAAEDAADDLALGNAVATADLGRIREGGNGGVRVQLRPSRREGLTEDQCLPYPGNVFLRPEQVEIPVAVGGLAIEHRADHAVVAHHHTLVDPASGVAQDDVLRSVAARKIARREQVDSRNLELGRGYRAGEP